MPSFSIGAGDNRLLSQMTTNLDHFRWPAPLQFGFVWLGTATGLPVAMAIY
jgi:hypothetical protein